jgi:hypothetical protein
MLRIDTSFDSSGERFQKVPALSCHPCNAIIGCTSDGPHHMPIYFIMHIDN